MQEEHAPPTAGTSPTDERAEAAILAPASALPAAAQALAEAPPLAWLAALAALADVAYNRMFLRAFHDAFERAQAITLGRWGALPRNLATIAAIGALAIGLVALVRLRDVAPLSRRIGVASFAGLFLPTCLISLVTPPASTTPTVVLFGTASASVLVVMIAIVALPWRAPGASRVALGASTMSVFGAFCALVISIVAPAFDPTLGDEAALVTNRFAEGLYLAVGPAIALTVLAGGRVTSPIAVALGALTSGVGVVAFVVLRRKALESFETILYGATRLELFLTLSPAIYVAVLSITVGAGIAALFSKHPAFRQIGAAAWLWNAAGFAPRTLQGAVLVALAVVLLARACIALAVARHIARTGPVVGDA